jgi:hypothetical protein
MKKIFSALVLFGFVSDAFADDWRMRKFDLDSDGFIAKPELMAAGCNYKAVTYFFDRADKNGDELLGKLEARKATHYIFKSNCPREPKVASIRG